MTHKEGISVKFTDGMGIFDHHFGYPEIDYKEKYNGPTGKVKDIQGPQAHAGRNFLVPEGKEFSFDISECPYLHIAIKAEKDTKTCLMLMVHDREPAKHKNRFVVIGKTPEGDPGIYDVITYCFTIVDDGQWHEYDFDLRNIREKDEEYPYFPSAGSISGIQFYSWSGSGEHAFHFNDLVCKPIVTTSKPFVVKGHVSYANSMPYAIVRAFDKDLRKEELLGEAKTDPQGYYEIHYSPEQFRRPEKGNADLRVCVVDENGNELVSSELLKNAPAEAVIDLTLPSEKERLSEYELLVNAITPLLKGQGKGGKDLPVTELNEKDIDFLAKVSGEPRERIFWLSESERRGQEVLDTGAIPAEIFYGWFRQNLPTSLTGLLGQDIKSLRTALERSVQNGIIPLLSGSEVDDFSNKLLALKVSLKLKPSDKDQTPSLGDLLKTTLLNTDKQRSIAALQLEHDGASETFWKALNERNEFSEEEIKSVRLTLQLEAFTGSHMPLIHELQRIAQADQDVAKAKRVPVSELYQQKVLNFAEANANELRPFAKLDITDWKNLLMRPQPDGQPIGAPATIPGADLQEKIDNYAAVLNQHIENVLPTAVIASRLEKDTGDDSPFKSAHADLKTFFDNNPSFEFKGTPVDLYLSEGCEKKFANVTDPAGLKAQLKSMERVFNNTRRYQEMRALLADDLHSATAIVHVGERKFIEKYKEALGDETRAIEVYRKAEHVYATALNVYMKHSVAFNSPLPYVISGGERRMPVANSFLADNISALREVPDWSTLFGSLDLCDCRYCRSLYSPAAYLVDILRFLNDGPTKKGMTPLQMLLRRRPDIEHIELICKHTDTQVPCVDMANEILEAAIVPRSFWFRGDSSVRNALRAGEISSLMKTVFANNGYALSDKASLRIDAGKGSNPKWIILDSGWAFTVRFVNERERFEVDAWPQTSWTSDELRANPEHIHDPAYAVLRMAVYPWNLPLNLPLEEMRTYLGHLGVKRHVVMETFFRGDPSKCLSEKNIALEYLGLTNEEANIITGVTTGAPADTTSKPAPWDFWGLSETGNDIVDPTDVWDVVLQRVSIFLQQSGLSYKELLELLGTYFINPPASAGTPGGRLLGIVSIGDADPVTCNRSKLEIKVVDNEILNTKGKLKAVWNKIHRFVRLWRKLGWTMQELDKTITALDPPDLNDNFLIQLSHIQRMRAALNVPLETILSWYSIIDTASYFDHLAAGQPEIKSFYEQLFLNKAVINPVDIAFLLNSIRNELKNPSAGTNHESIKSHIPAIIAALGISDADLSLILGFTQSISRQAVTYSMNGTGVDLTRNKCPMFVLDLGKITEADNRFSIKFQESDDNITYTDIPDSSLQGGGQPAVIDQNNDDQVIRRPYVGSNKFLRVAVTDVQGISPGLMIQAQIVMVSHVSDEMNLANLSMLYRISSLAKTLKLSIREWLIIRELTNIDPFASTEATLHFVEKAGVIRSSGFGIDELDYLLRHDFTLSSGIAPAEEAIALTLDEIRRGLQKIAAENVFCEDPDDPNGMTTDPVGELTRKKLALLDWDTGIIEQVVATLCDDERFKLSRTFISRHMRTFPVQDFAADLDALPVSVTFPNALKSKVYFDAEAKKLHFIGIMTEQQRDALSGLSTDTSDLKHKSYLAAINSLFTQPDALAATFLDDPAIANLFDNPTASADRFILVLDKLLPYLRQILSERLVVQKMAEALNLEAKTAAELMTKHVNSPAHPAQKCISEFLAPNFAGSNLNVNLTAAAFSSQFRTFTRLHKIAGLVIKFKITPDQLTWLFEYGPDVGWLNLNALPTATTSSASALFAGWERLVDLFRLRDQLPEGESVLSDVFCMARDTTINVTYLFIWDGVADTEKVPGNEKYKLIYYLKDKFGLDWLDPVYVIIRKIDNGNTIKVKGPFVWPPFPQNYILIKLNNTKTKVNLTISTDKRTSEFVAKLENSKLNIYNVTNLQKETNLLQKLSWYTGWSLDNLQFLVDTQGLDFTFPKSYKDERALMRLYACFKMMKRLGASAEQLSKWGKINQTPEEELENARSIKNMVKAKYDDKQWLTVAKPLKDPLREKQRAALVAYLITHPAKDPVKGQLWRDVNELYEYFLIDVEMTPCMMTTRIKQAISSVQLFVQRSLMNLESGVSLTSKEAQQWAQWRKWYRVWEANRKVLLYPENWIEPELRDDKSPFYKDLENELLQSDVTMDTAEDAFLHYLEELDQVARLEIMGMYLQKAETGTDILGRPETDTLHVFGRTYTTPHIYFYRCLEGDVWTAWEKVDLDIEGDHLIPVAWNRRLYLFWSIFTEKSEQPTKEQRKKDEDPGKYWEIKLAWSEYKNERWSSKKVSKEHLRYNKYPYPTLYLFCWDEIPGNDNVRLIHILMEKYDTLTWIQFAKITKTDKDKTVKIKYGTKSLSLNLDNDNTELKLTLPNGKIDKFNVKTENGKINIYPTTDAPQDPLLVVPQDPQDFSFKTQILQSLAGKQLIIECYGTIVDTVLQQPEQIPIPPVTDKIQLFGILTPHKVPIVDSKGFREVHVPTYIKCRFLIGDRKPNKDEGAKIKIYICKNFLGDKLDSGEICDIIALNSNGIAYSTKAYEDIVFLHLVSKDYELESSGKDEGSWIPTDPSSHPKAVYEALIDVVDDIAAGFPANAGAVIISTLPTFGRRMIVKLKVRTPPPPIQQPEPGYVTTPKPMQGIGEFILNDCNGDLAAVPVAQLNSMCPTNLNPLPGTQFQSMAMVEFEKSDGTLGQDDNMILWETPGGKFRLLFAHQKYDLLEYGWWFFFQDEKRTYFVFPHKVSGDIGGEGFNLRFSTFYHPRIGEFMKSLSRHGIGGLLTLNNQRLTDKTSEFLKYWADPNFVDDTLLPREDVDFSPCGTYSQYNWEIFFHTPFLIAMQLSKNQRFEEAQKWFHYIFDPTATDSPDMPGNPGIERFWRVKPFYDEAMQGIQTLEALIADATKLDAQVANWEADPFKPHVIARIRKVAYMKAVVMRYIDNLIAWGDQLFRRDTIESINEATQLYILAAQILGKRPENIPARARAKLQTFRTLDDIKALDSLSNAVVEIESFLPPSAAPIPAEGMQGGALFMPFFCIPGNDMLLGYWDTVGDRLFKIRHCMNIEGVERSLPIFEPPIDPGLLVRAAAAGVDIASALNDINSAVPYYRFNVMVQKASELCNDVKALGGALLSALEKRDAEALSLLRSTHEVELLKAIRGIKEQQVEEAKNTHAGLLKYQEVVTARQQFYQSREFMNPFEIGHLALMTNSLIPMGVQLGSEVTAAVLHLIPGIKTGAPTTIGATYGGDNVGPAAQAFGSAAGVTASMLNTGASLSATLGSYQRRQEDWTHQADLATKELKQVEKQIAAAEIRLAISDSELINHDTQIENAKEVDEYMRGKFTNQQLYSWMVGQISGIYFQSYQLAYDVSKRAERAFRHELGLKDSNFIQFGYWDSLKKGLLSGERLHHDLKRMEVAYLDKNKREYEITKHISLITIDPISLVKLKETGECFISLPEALFDMDYPGHYMRRIKSVSITIPCVTGPYAGVNCTLTQQSSTIRHASILPSGSYKRQGDDKRFSDSFGTIQSIVTSSGQNDSGLFEANLRDERYLPFEGQGAISTWRIQLPTQFKSFDYDTISDVILHLHYTAREGGDLLRNGAVENLKTMIDEAQASGSVRLFSVRHEFPTEWAKFTRVESVSSDNPAGLTLNLKPEHYPFWSIDRLETVKQLELFARTTESVEVSDKVDAKGKLDEAGKIALGNSPLALMTGKLPNTVDLSPTGPLTLYFGNNSMEDLWLALTWGK